jgi:hypothetical protein
LAATAIVVPLAAGLGDGLVAAGLGEGLVAAGGGYAVVPDGLVTAVGDVEPQAAASNATAATAFVNSDFGCIWILLNRLPATHPDTRPGYEISGYSGVTYAALRPPSTRNVEPFT